MNAFLGMYTMYLTRYERIREERRLTPYQTSFTEQRKAAALPLKNVVSVKFEWESLI